MQITDKFYPHTLRHTLGTRRLIFFKKKYYRLVQDQVTDHLYRYAVRGYSYLVSVTEPAGTLSTKFSTDQSTALDLTAKFNRRF